MGDPSLSGFSVLDGNGREMSVFLFEGARYNQSQIGRIRNGRTPVYCVGEDATTLVLRDAEGEEMGRETLDLVPGTVVVVRY